jgi:cytochrome d ubiquinol oxidase subunit II
MEPSLLQILWFVLFGVLVAGYAVLDGFDLGVGTLSLLRTSRDDRRLMMKAIAPVWDGNEVWLLTAGGALFAAFPMAYATVFSGFYLALMLLLLALIARAVSLEFAYLVENPRWQRFFEVAFGLGSLVPSLLLGVAVGNIVRGIPLSADGEPAVSFLGLLHPYALLFGLLSLAMFVTQGAVYLSAKTDGALRQWLVAVATKGFVAWSALFVAGTIATIFFAARQLEHVLDRWPTFVLFPLSLAALAYLPVALQAERFHRAFIASSTAIVAQIGLIGTGLFPYLVPSLDPNVPSLTLANASSSPLTLTTMLVIAGLGMPLVLVYTVLVHRVFRGKVTPGSGY